MMKYKDMRNEKGRCARSSKDQQYVGSHKSVSVKPLYRRV